MAGPLSTDRLAELLASDERLSENDADALIRHHGVKVWRVANSVAPRDCMPRSVSIYDLRLAHGLYCSRKAAYEESLSLLRQRLRETESLIRQAEKEITALHKPPSDTKTTSSVVGFQWSNGHKRQTRKEQG